MSGRLTHFELPADDTARARAFYSGLFGWEYTAWEGPLEYHMVQSEPSGAIYPRQEDDAGPRIWFDAVDVDTQIARVRELGGEASDRAPIPGVGWFTLCTDTEGNRFGIIQSDESAAQPPEGS